MKLPGKKIIILGIIALVIVGGIFFLSYRAEHPSQPRGTTLSVEEPTNLFKKLEEIDTDKDGLKDWEEALWNSDRNDPDTDKDGTNDGEEVKEGRNPTKPGPNDKVDTTIVASSTFATAAKNISANSASNESLTRQTAIDLFTKYMDLKQSGTPINGDLQDALVQGVMADSARNTPKATVYSQGDFSIIENATSEDIRQYGNALGAIFIKNNKRGTDSELLTLQKIAQTQNMELASKLDPVAEEYKETLKDLLAMQVPRPLIEQHAALTTSLGAVTKNIEGLKNMNTDPLGAASELNEYAGNVQIMTTAFQNIVSYIRQQNISFGSNETGSFIMNMAH